MDKLKMRSENLVDENIEFIAKKFPNAIVEARDENGNLSRMVDFDVLKQELSKEIVESDKERYQMTWPGKKQAILTANAPVAMTLRPCKEDSVDFNNTQNIYIEGDNLDVLKVIRETYHGKVKMIYIDPPYNTGNDFVYNDDFATDTEDYLERSNQVDDQGNRMSVNSESNGRFHSDWLNMMYPRLKVAKDFLTEDGVIFISIDENEMSNLKKMCDEIFGAGNYVNTFCWVNNLKGRQISYTGAVRTYEYVLCYAKDYEKLCLFQGKIDKLKTLMPSTYKGFNYEPRRDEIGEYVIKNELYNTNSMFNEETRPNLVFCIHYNPSTKEIKFSDPKDNINYTNFVKIMPKTCNDGKHKYQAWRWSKQKIEKEFYDLEFVPYQNTFKIYTKIRDFNVTNIKDVITEIGNGNAELEKYFGTTNYFSFPKSTDLIKLFLMCIQDKNALIMDFFSGSATTADATLQLNLEDNGHRKFIMVQLEELIDKQSEAYMAGFENICKIAEERIRRAGKKIKEENVNAQNLDIGFRVFKLDSSNMKDTYYEPNQYSTNLLDQLDENIKSDRTPEDLLFQVLLDLGLMLDSKIEIKMINGKKVFVVGEYNEAIDPDLICCFDSDVDNNTVTEIAKLKPRYCVFRDSSMAKDSVATNFDQIFETYSPSTTRKVL
mgnify:CR=1 FL=1